MSSAEKPQYHTVEEYLALALKSIMGCDRVVLLDVKSNEVAPFGVRSIGALRTGGDAPLTPGYILKVVSGQKTGEATRTRVVLTGCCLRLARKISYHGQAGTSA